MWYNRINVVLCGVKAKGETDRGMRYFGVIFCGHQDVGGLAVARGAGGAGRDDDILGVEVELNRLTFGGGERGVKDIRERVVQGSIKAGMGDFIENLSGEIIAKRFDVLLI